MDYFKINYHKLAHLKQLKFFYFVIIVLLVFIILLVVATRIKIYHKISTTGIYNDNILNIKINYKLSDIVKNSQYIKFNEKKTNYEIAAFNDYEIMDNEIYQTISLTVDKEFVNNEIGVLEFYYKKQTILKYFLELFK